LNRARILPETLAADLAQTLDTVVQQLDSGSIDKKLARKLDSMAAAIVGISGTPATQKQQSGLAKTLNGIAASLR